MSHTRCMMAKGTVGAVSVAALVLCITASVFAQTVTTDRPDYFPGEVVTITGAGWQPGEPVSIRITEDPSYNPDVLLAAVADSYGSFTNTDFAPPENAYGTAYTLTAWGYSLHSSTYDRLGCG